MYLDFLVRFLGLGLQIGSMEAHSLPKLKCSECRAPGVRTATRAPDRDSSGIYIYLLVVSSTTDYLATSDICTIYRHDIYTCAGVFV
jgi:hypothetical protein